MYIRSIRSGTYILCLAPGSRLHRLRQGHTGLGLRRDVLLSLRLRLDVFSGTFYSASAAGCSPGIQLRRLSKTSLRFFHTCAPELPEDFSNITHIKVDHTREFLIFHTQPRMAKKSFFPADFNFFFKLFILLYSLRNRFEILKYLS